MTFETLLPMKYVLSFFIGLLWLTSHSQTDSLLDLDKSMLPYRTLNLKNGYTLLIVTTDEKRILHLTGPGVDTVLKKIDISTNPRHLGHIIGDYDECFIMYFPENEVQVFNKQSGDVLVKGSFTDKDTNNHVVYFIDHRKDDQLGIIDLKTLEVKWYMPPETSCQKWWVCIRDKFLYENELILEYLALDGRVKKRFYSR